MSSVTPSSATRATAAPGPAGAAVPRSRPHIIAFDLIRLIIMVFVVSVHTLAFAGGSVTFSIGAVTTVFHTSRELFLLLTALVLTYNYGHRDRLRVWKFWRRRFWLVLPAYVAWSAIYYAADGRSRGSFPLGFLHDLATAGARYHLYFLLVSMQIYLLFPALRWVLKKTEGYHAWVFSVAVVYQILLTCSLHYHIGRSGHSWYAQWLNAAGLGYWVETYVLYVVAGALAGWHFDRLCAFARRHLGSWPRVSVAAALGVAAGLGVYLVEIEVFGATPGNASAVFQPVVVFEALAFGLALLGAGLLWSDRGAPGRRFATAGSASSFGIYLAHPLILQGLLVAGGSAYLGAHGGIIGALRRVGVPGGQLLALLFLLVPVIYALAWVLASAARRSPFSLPLTGREYRGRRVLPRIRWRLLPRKLVVALSMVTAVAVVAAGCAAARVISTRAHTSASAPSGPGLPANSSTSTSTTTNHTMRVGAMTRTYTVIAPAKPLPESAPVIVFLSGLNSTQSQEIGRDQFTSYVNAGQAELVYPLAFRKSWNAIGCCSYASKDAIDDTGFITSLVSVVDPGHKRPIYVVGYSNGGRLAYRLACGNPLLFDAYAIVKASPQPGCTVQIPLKIMTIAATDDTFVPYEPGDKGEEKPAATVQNADLRSSSACSSATVRQAQGNMTYTLWSHCADGTSVGFAVYTVGVHSYPRPPVSFPAASQVMWAFFTGKTVQPQPSPA